MYLNTKQSKFSHFSAIQIELKPAQSAAINGYRSEITSHFNVDGPITSLIAANYTPRDKTELCLSYKVHWREVHNNLTHISLPV